MRRLSLTEAKICAILVKKGKARAAVHLNVNFAGQIYDRIREHPQYAWLPK